MCILKISSERNSFKPYLSELSLPVFSVFDKGEYRDLAKKRPHEKYRLSIDVSDREWDDFPGQVDDAIKFLKKYQRELDRLFTLVDDSDACLDFPLYSRLDEEIINQNDHLPRELIALAGKLNIGIEMSIYSKDVFQ